MEYVIGTKFLSEQRAEALENTVGITQKVPIKICAKRGAMCFSEVRGWEKFR